MSALSQQVTSRHQQTDVHESITTQDRNNIKDPQKKLRLGTVIKYYFTGDLNRFNGVPASPLVQMWIKTHEANLKMHSIAAMFQWWIRTIIRGLFNLRLVDDKTKIYRCLLRKYLLGAYMYLINVDTRTCSMSSVCPFWLMNRTINLLLDWSRDSARIAQRLNSFTLYLAVESMHIKQNRSDINH